MSNALFEYAEFRLSKLMEAKAQYEKNIEILMNDIQVIDQEIAILEKVKLENWG